MVEPSICLRLKRNNQTFFINTKKSKSTMSIKEQLCDIISKQQNDNSSMTTATTVPSPTKIRLYYAAHDDDNNNNEKRYNLLSANSLLSDYEHIKYNSILYIIYRKKGMEDENDTDEFGQLDHVWEDVNDIVPLTMKIYEDENE